MGPYKFFFGTFLSTFLFIHVLKVLARNIQMNKDKNNLFIIKVSSQL